MYIDITVYDQILDRILNLLKNSCENNETYEIHVNLEGFTMTSVERHKAVIEQFCQRMNETKYFDYMHIMHIYNTPSMIDAISNIFSYFIHPNIKHNIIKYFKPESEEKIAQLLSNNIRTI